MPRKDAGLGLTAKEIEQMFADPAWANKFPPFLTVKQAAALLQVPVNTIYGWSSQGKLERCSRRLGKHLRFVRNLLINDFQNGLNQNAR